MAFDKTALHATADNVAFTLRAIADFIGAAATVTTVKHYIASLKTRIAAFADTDWEPPLQAAANAADESEAEAMRFVVYKQIAKALANSALAIEKDTFSDFYAGLRTRTDRLPPELGQLFRATGGQIEPEYVWPPLATLFSTVVAPGATINQTIVDEPVDTNYYAGALLETEVAVQIAMAGGGANILVTVTGEQFNGDIGVVSGTILDGAIIGSKVNLTSTPQVFLKKVTSIVITPNAGTWAAGTFLVQSKDDRVLAE
jgi:hypothetical protein